MENYFRCYASMFLKDLTFKELTKLAEEFKLSGKDENANVYDDLVNFLKESYEDGRYIDEVVDEMHIYLNED